MKKIVLALIVMMYAFSGGLAASDAFSAVSDKSFSIVYSSDERGAITPCG